MEYQFETSFDLWLFWWLGASHVPLIAWSKLIEVHGAGLSVGIQLLSGETFLQENNSTVIEWTRIQVLAYSIQLLISNILISNITISCSLLAMHTQNRQKDGSETAVL